MLVAFFCLFAATFAVSLQSWLESRGVLGKKVQISDINGSPVVVASKLISEGDVVLSIPRDQMIRSDSLPDFEDIALAKDVQSPVFRLGMYFLETLDKEMMGVSYRDYVKACGYSYNPAVLWSDKSIDLLKGSPVERLAREGKEDIKNTFKEFKDKAKNSYLLKGKWSDIADAMRLVLAHTINIHVDNDDNSREDTLVFVPLVGLLRNPSEYSNDRGNVELVIPEDESEPIKLVARESIPILGEITLDISSLQKNTGKKDNDDDNDDDEKQEESPRQSGIANSTILLKSGHVIGKITLNPDDKVSKSIVTDNDVSNIYDVYLLHFSPEVSKKKENDEEEDEDSNDIDSVDIVKELKQALLKASHLPSGPATIAISKGELETDNKQEIRGVPEALLVMLRIHLARSEEFGNIGNALKGIPVSLENELVMCRSLVSTIQNILDGYEHTLQEDISSYSEAVKKFTSEEVQKGYKLGEKISAIKYTLIERDLLITVARNIQFHWMRLLEV